VYQKGSIHKGEVERISIKNYEVTLNKVNLLK